MFFMHLPLCPHPMSVHASTFAPSSLYVFHASTSVSSSHVCSCIYFCAVIALCLIMHLLLRPRRFMFNHAFTFAPSSLYLYSCIYFCAVIAICFLCIYLCVLIPCVFMHPLLRRHRYMFFMHLPLCPHPMSVHASTFAPSSLYVFHASTSVSSSHVCSCIYFCALVAISLFMHLLLRRHRYISAHVSSPFTMLFSHASI